MRSFLFTSIGLLLLLSGCQSIPPRHLTPVSHHLPSDTFLPTAHCTLPTFFSPPTFQKALFKASMDIREHHLTGLLFIKMIPQLRSSRCDNDTVSLPAYRIVCSNEFGMTYFDLEVAPGVFRLNYCFEPLNKNALWRILETDFRLLLSPEAGTIPIKTFVQEESNYLVCKSKQGGISRWDLYSPMGDTLLEVRGKSSLADPSWISYAGYHREFPSRINISNPLIKLKLSLSLLSLN